MGKAEAERRWTDLLSLPNVPVHTSLLPNGKVLHWSWRKNPKLDLEHSDPNIASLDEHFTVSFL